MNDSRLFRVVSFCFDRAANAHARMSPTSSLRHRSSSAMLSKTIHELWLGVANNIIFSYILELSREFT